MPRSPNPSELMDLAIEPQLLTSHTQKMTRHARHDMPPCDRTQYHPKSTSYKGKSSGNLM